MFFNKQIQKRLDNSEALIVSLEKEVQKLKEEKQALQHHVCSVRGVIERMFEYPPEWFDFSELKPQDLAQYYEQAQRTLSSDPFVNEINFLKSNWGKQAVLEAESSPDVSEHIKKLSWMLLGIELLKIRLEEIPSPQTNTTANDVYSAV